jgi:hypothetical protein
MLLHVNLEALGPTEGQAAVIDGAHKHFLLIVR